MAQNHKSISRFFNNISTSYAPWFQKDIYYLAMLKKITVILKKHKLLSITELIFCTSSLIRQPLKMCFGDKFSVFHILSSPSSSRDHKSAKTVHVVGKIPQVDFDFGTDNADSPNILIINNKTSI